MVLWHSASDGVALLIWYALVICDTRAMDMPWRSAMTLSGSPDAAACAIRWLRSVCLVDIEPKYMSVQCCSQWHIGTRYVVTDGMSYKARWGWLRNMNWWA